MKDFLYIIRGGHGMSNMSPEEMQEHMKEWQAWMGGLAEKGLLVGGEPLEKEGKSFTSGGTEIIDRPLVEGKEMVGGYLIMKANNLDEAVEQGKGCPGFKDGISLEVRAIAVLPS